ncbi:MAG: hypothetical protein IJO98_05845 [Clostridia bacterium]|nr:hypothetical protein [Clostridia bacterium]
MKKFLSMILILAAMMTVAVMPASADEIKDLRTYTLANSELETWNILATQSSRDLVVLTNLIDGLLTNDNNGNLISNIAKEWYSEDGGKTWTFKLNEGIQWVDVNGSVKAEVVANDWLVGLEWVLNFAKNDSVNTSMPIEMIEGAGEYYEYTKNLTETEGAEAALALGTDKLTEMVGIAAPDAYTLVYTCTDKLSYFPSLACYNCLFPLSAGLVEELGVEGYKNLTWEQLWYSGPYLMEDFIHMNEKTFVKNENYWNKDNVKLFDSVNVKILETDEAAYLLFQTGELDNASLGQSTLASIYESESHEFHDNLVPRRNKPYSNRIHFCFDKKNEDGTPDTNWNMAVGNEAFRLAWYYGLDLTSYLGRVNAIDPLSCQNLAYTSAAVVTTTDGRDYVELVYDEIGMRPDAEKFPRYDAEKAAAYKAQAIEELTAEGVTFPVEVDYYIQGSDQSAKDTADVLAQIMRDGLGEDFVTLNICTYVSSSTNEVRTPQLASFYLTGWSADFADPVNFLGCETYADDTAFYSNTYSKINQSSDADLIASYEEYTALVNAAKAITDDTDARYAAFAKAEAYLLNHAFVIPMNINGAYQLSCINDYSKIYSAYGMQTPRYVNWETNDQIYTTAEYAELAP